MLYYVSGVKIYCAVYDESKKFYPECKLVRTKDGSFRVVSLSGGIPIKPKQRELCTFEELVAKFGNASAAPAPADPPKAGNA